MLASRRRDQVSMLVYALHLQARPWHDSTHVHHPESCWTGTSSGASARPSGPGSRLEATWLSWTTVHGVSDGVVMLSLSCHNPTLPPPGSHAPFLVSRVSRVAVCNRARVDGVGVGSHPPVLCSNIMRRSGGRAIAMHYYPALPSRLRLFPSCLSCSSTQVPTSHEFLFSITTLSRVCLFLFSSLLPQLKPLHSFFDVQLVWLWLLPLFLNPFPTFSTRNPWSGPSIVPFLANLPSRSWYPVFSFRNVDHTKLRLSSFAIGNTRQFIQREGHLSTRKRSLPPPLRATSPSILSAASSACSSLRTTLFFLLLFLETGPRFVRHDDVDSHSRQDSPTNGTFQNQIR